MERSIGAVGSTLRSLAASLDLGEPLEAQVALAREAERSMLATFGANTHKGALFLGGLLLTAVHRAGTEEESSLRGAIGWTAGQLAPLLAVEETHGAAARTRFRVGGILREARLGMPAVFDVALPAARASIARGESLEATSFRMLARLMQTVEDTTALHRCGVGGLWTIRNDGYVLERRLATGRAIEFLRARNEEYRRRNLTMGGVADLLGVALGLLVHSGEIPVG